MLSVSTFTTDSQAQTRSLKLYYLHTGEKSTITYKRGGKYIKSGLKKMNRFLRDWRRNEPTKMDPRLLDLIWEVYKESGSRAYIHVISGYRSPKTNNMLRRRGRGVAKRSQHTLGKAMDFFLPDVKLAKLRKIGLIKQVGGVGYYPSSGSPFIHLDTGSVRHWPRMSRSQLVKIFPRGKTLHVPSDRKPLKGYNVAKANHAKYKRRSGKIVISKEKELPKKSPKTGPKTVKEQKTPDAPKKKRSFFALFRGADDDEGETANSATAPRAVKTTSQPVKPENSSDPFNPFANQTPGAIQIAQLPLHAPIPTAAPREALQARELILAALSNRQIENNVQPATPAPVTPSVAARKPELQPEEPAVVAINVPTTPVEPAPAPVQPAPSKSSIEARILLALADPLQPSSRIGTKENPIPVKSPPKQSKFATVLKNPTKSFEVAALSPSEIEDLRSEIRYTLAATRTLKQKLPISTKKAMTPLFASKRVVPVVDVPESGLPTPKPTLLTALLPEEPINVTSEFALRLERASLQPMEPGTKFSNHVATPLEMPNRKTEPKSIDSVILASLEVPPQLMIPTQKPRSTALRDISGTSPITIASLTREHSETAPANFDVSRLDKTTPVKSLAKRTISLSRFSMTGLEDNAVGRWALVKNASIREISEISPPAYGRNIIRELPSIILTAGFTRVLAGVNTDRFSGSSLEFLAFSKFDSK
ncbi:MAG: DUF882 domain-containing protein [Rhizobiaceae bacterium]|nr:DUF882 domain-containing protein [Rhizobiaceae bacterium]